MRIIGGEFGGRALVTPRSHAIRPSADRLRQTLFDILAHSHGDAVEGARVLDLFAGTGALGIEALSRGAAYALFIEDAVEARGLIRQNVEVLGLTGRTRIFRRDATRLGSAGTIAPFGLVFVDPPYRQGLGEQALASAHAGGWLASGALAVLEEDEKTEIGPLDGFERLDRRVVGDSQLLFLKLR
jgi:16S rRNA (guanine966-N2)-methyltransferase